MVTGHFHSALLLSAAAALCACNAVLSIPDRKVDPNLVCTDSGCACAGGFASCDGDDETGCETDLQVDATSCGVCGHDCLGGRCDEGRCEPVAVLSETGLNDIVVVDGSIYVSSNNSPIRRIPVAGTKENAEVLSGTTPGGMLRADGGILYWTTVSQILSGPIEGGGAPAILVEGVSPVDDMAIGGGYIYFDNFDSVATAYTMSRIPTQGGAVEVIPQINPAVDEPWSVLADETRVYWSIQGGIVTTTHAAMAPTLLGQVFGLPYRMIKDETDIYWLGDGIYTMPLAGAVQAKLAPSAFGGSLAADATDVYYTSDMGTVQKVSKAGGDPVELAAGQVFGLAFNTHPAVDEKAIYWVTQDGLYRLVK